MNFLVNSIFGTTLKKTKVHIRAVYSELVVSVSIFILNNSMENMYCECCKSHRGVRKTHTVINH